MAKWFGAIGYAETVETTPGVWEEQITERYYYGELRRNSRRLQTSDKVNDDVTINNELSIVADPCAYQNFHAMRYAKWMNTKWKITDIQVEYPRLTISLGGLYTDD